MLKITKAQAIFMLIVFVVSIILLFWGQRNVGYTGLLAEFIGIIGLILDLYLYNRQFK